jgi:shikimate kinase
MPRPRHVVLVGLMGSGKTTIGNLLARRLGRPYLDNDVELERVTGRTAHDIAAAEGLDVLHAQEAASLLTTLARDEPAVIGAPASAIADPEVRARLKNAFVVWLDTDLDTLARRFDRKKHRPSLQGAPRDFLQQQYRERAPLYRDVASYIVHSGGEDSRDRTVDEIARALGTPASGGTDVRSVGTEGEGGRQ